MVMTMKKKSLLIMLICLIIPLFMTGCIFSDNQQETSAPTLKITTDSRLVYSEANERYEITIPAGESYTLDVNLGDYTGDDYNIVYSWNSSGTNYASIENKVITINKDAPSYLNPELTIKLQEKDSTKAIDTKKYTL